MKIQHPTSNIQKLRKKYRKFVYESYDWKIKNSDLETSFSFKVGDIRFRPKIIIKNINIARLGRIGDGVLNNLIFHLGLMEIPSYWKATCSPLIEIRAGFLDPDREKWWKNFIIDGMGQFFYENKIDWRTPAFLKIASCGPEFRTFNSLLKNRYLVPFAGGRDSIVTLEKLKEPFDTAQGKQKKEIALFTVNPIEKIQKTVKVSGIKKQIIVQRIIDKKLLALNKKGYLNGHTPFTALLSFISVLCAVIFDYKNIAFSNEKSADEGNVKYLGKIINHQWAKSSSFEKMFSYYARKFLAKNINYFSFLRKYGELEISKMLAKYPQYFPVFSSCNAGMRIAKESSASAKSFGETRWCGNCPKCLFVYMSLYPFLSEKKLLKIFNENLFENRKLLPIFRQLTGGRGPKPFECVGTKAESRKAVALCFKKIRNSGKIPFLLKYK